MGEGQATLRSAFPLGEGKVASRGSAPRGEGTSNELERDRPRSNEIVLEIAPPPREKGPEMWWSSTRPLPPPPPATPRGSPTYLVRVRVRVS